MTGYCPHCGRELTGLTVAARGYCEEHGWRWADWTRPRDTRRGLTDMRRDLGRAPTAQEWAEERR